MTAQCLPSGIHIVIGYTEILAGLCNNRSYLWVVGLNDPGEEVVGGLMVECSSEHSPEPTVGSIVLRGSYLHLSPASESRERQLQECSMSTSE